MELKEIPLDQIDIGNINVRKSNLEEGIDELAKNIDEIGLQQPVVVFQKPDKRYELIIGQRRYLAFIRAGKDKIPALQVSIKNERDAIMRSFSENLHRLDLEYKDKMQAAILLLNKSKNDINEVAKMLGVSTQTVRNYLGYDAVPEQIKKMVDNGKLAPTTALRIAQSIPNEELAVNVAKKIRKMPRGADRSLMIDVAKENPGKTIGEINKIAKKQKQYIRVHLTASLFSALTKASNEYKSEKEDLIKEALIEWLKKRGYVQT